MGGITMTTIIELTGINKRAKETIKENDYMECENPSDETWLKREFFANGASWMLVKAIEWLIDNVEDYAEPNFQYYCVDFDRKKFIADFKKAMEG